MLSTYGQRGNWSTPKRPDCAMISRAIALLAYCMKHSLNVQLIFLKHLHGFMHVELLYFLNVTKMFNVYASVYSTIHSKKFNSHLLKIGKCNSIE